MRVYFDYAATTPLDPKVQNAMQPYFFDVFGNVSSAHGFGREALDGVDFARQQVAEFLNCKPLEIIFTSGATESNNLVLQGLVGSGDHIITSAIEHPAVLDVCKHLEKTGVDVTYLDPASDGIINVDDIVNAITDTTKLISVMYVNNELGTIQPIVEIGEKLKEINRTRKDKIYFHTDAVQAARYLDMNINNLGVDFLSMSGHKIYGPKGVGVLFKKNNVDLNKVVHGGPQEFSLRPGTLNTPAIIGCGAAINLLGNKDDKVLVEKLSVQIISGIKKIAPNAQFNGDLERQAPGFIHVSFDGFNSERLLIALDQKGIAISVGAACSVGSLRPSHVLDAIGLNKDSSESSIRITLGRYSNEKEVKYFLKVLEGVIA